MGYRMETLKYYVNYDSVLEGTFTNSSTANTAVSTGAGIGVNPLPNYAGEYTYIAEVDVTGASAPGVIYIYFTTGSAPPVGQPPNAGDSLLAEIPYGTGAFRYKAICATPPSNEGTFYIAISSGTASSTISIAQFLLTTIIALFVFKA